MAENLDDFLDPYLRKTATLQGGATVYGYFDAAYQDALGVAGINPVFQCKATDVLASDMNKTLAIDGVTYVIRNRQPIDDGAFVLLQFQLQS